MLASKKPSSLSHRQMKMKKPSSNLCPIVVVATKTFSQSHKLERLCIPEGSLALLTNIERDF
jgi:hypothetical protein